jgi:hypothetical protein
MTSQLLVPWHKSSTPSIPCEYLLTSVRPAIFIFWQDYLYILSVNRALFFLINDPFVLTSDVGWLLSHEIWAYRAQHLGVGFSFDMLIFQYMVPLITCHSGP